MKATLWTLALAWAGTCIAAQAAEPPCLPNARPQVTFIQYASPNLATVPPSALTIKGKLSVPAVFDAARRCFVAGTRLPTVLIAHGSAGVDARGDFHEQALNDAGFATLQIDMWEARGVTTPATRPALPILTYPDVFNALAFLSAQPAVDPARVGILGFSWGGVMSLGASEQLYVAQFGGGRSFKAHVAHYPVCYGANNAQVLAGFGLTPAQAGTQYLNPTGAPVLIQIGTLDDYDNGAEPCRELAKSITASGKAPMSVEAYEGAYHAWDRLMVPITVQDPFADRGSFFATGVLPSVRIVPDVDAAYASRTKVVRFFRRHL